MPLTAHQQPAWTNPRRWGQGAAALGAATTLGLRLRGARSTRRLPDANPRGWGVSMTIVDHRQMHVMVHELLNRHPCVGLAVGVVRGGSLDFFHAHGVADVASGEPITADTVFRVASITKTFTTIAVLQLVELGADRPRRARRPVPARTSG